MAAEVEDDLTLAPISSRDALVEGPLHPAGGFVPAFFILNCAAQNRASWVFAGALAVAAVFLGAGISRAQVVPPLINYSASLTDSSGKPVSGTKTMTFRVFDDPVLSAGHELWEETQTVRVSSGVFSVQLGSAAAWGYTVFAASSTYLEVQVGSDVLSPRARLVASPYAVNAQLLEGQDLSAFVLKDASGNVGIGTTAPAAKLEVSGGVKVGNDASACDASKAGTIIWTGTAFEGCTGSGWAAINLATCSPACQNGGTCSAPNTCTCPAGYTGATCGSWSCSSACQNGGTCSAPNTCTCANGYTGATCGTPPYLLTVTPAGTGSGAVTSSPAGINCGSTCTSGFASGASVALTAAANSGSTFAGWSGGGCSGTGPCAVTMSAAQSVTATFNVAASGVGPWAGTTSLPQPQWEHAMAAWNGRLYTTGGSTTGGPPYTGYSAPINADGSVGAWTQQTSLPIPVGNITMSAWNGRLYVAGGQMNNSCTSTSGAVYAAAINADGSIGSWTPQASLPYGVFLHAMSAWNGNLYVTGGSKGCSAGDIVSTVLVAPIGADGSAGPWTATTSLPQALSRHAMSAWNGWLYVTGGNNSGGPQPTVYAAPINANGTVGAWIQQTANPLPQALYNHAMSVANGVLYVTGGANATSAVSTVYTAPFGADGSVGTWTTQTANPLPQALYFHGMSAWNGRLYVTGGQNSTAQSTVYVAPLQGPAGSYVGQTAVSYTGNLGGFLGANASCQQRYAGSHWCSGQEIVASTPASVPSVSWVNCTSVDSHTMNCGGHVISNNQTINGVDCSGWTNGQTYSPGYSVGTAWGSNWGGAFGFAECGTPFTISCCITSQ